MTNAAEIREILEQSHKVRTVLMGHQHAGAVLKLNGILYYALRVQVCHSPTDNCFAIVTVMNDGTVTVQGFAQAVSYGI